MSLKILVAIDFKNGRFFASTVKIRTAMVLAKANQEETLMAAFEISLSNFANSNHVQITELDLQKINSQLLSPLS